MICDEQLVQQFLAGNRDSFRQIVEKYQAYVFAIIFKFVSEQDEAENIAQEVFLQVYRSLPSYRLENFKSWIGKITVAKALDWRRKKRKYLREELFTPRTELKIINKQEGNNPEDIFLKEENRQKVWEICKTLPQIYSRAIIKSYFEGKTYQQIASEEEVSLKTVESRLYRARILFKKRWKGEK